MEKYLPSKKFLYIIGSIILAILIVWGVPVLLKKQVEKPLSQQTTGAEQSAKIQEFLATDTDSDGLRDWEETLWKTDPQNTDTDGDKTSDFEEVKINRDPTKAAPGDEIDEKIIASQQQREAEYNKLTETEKLSRLLFSQYVVSKQGDELNQTDKQLILDSVILNTNSSGIQSYTLSDIKIVDDNSTSTIKNYVNQLGVVLDNNKNEERIYELNVLNDAINKNDAKELSKLDPIVGSYRSTVAGFLSVTVPRELANLHLDIVNNTSKIGFSIETFKYLYSDTLKAVNGLATYKKSTTDIIQNITNLKKYLEIKNVVLVESDPGYKLINVIK
ncbi:MAG: hypothetical protein WC027_00775 [Candidatus Paceibacterota bacterium]